jgi:hypothetical protein
VFDGSLDVPRARPFDVSYDAPTSPHVDGGPYDGSPDGGSYVLILRLSLAMLPFLVFMLQPTVSSDHLDQGATLFDLPSDFPDAYNVSRKFWCATSLYEYAIHWNLVQCGPSRRVLKLRLCNAWLQCLTESNSSTARTEIPTAPAGSLCTDEETEAEPEKGLDGWRNRSWTGERAEETEAEPEKLNRRSWTGVNEAPAASTDSGDSLAIQEDADVEPFMVPANYVLITAAPAMDKASLKRITKFAYKLPEGWETCTFKGFYTGKKAEHQGTCVMHFQVFRQSMYLDLKNNPYGLQESWVALKRVWFSHLVTCLFTNSQPLWVLVSS